MKKNILKITAIIFMIVLVISSLTTLCDATNVKEKFGGDVGELQGAANATTTIIGNILDVTRIIGISIAVIMLSYIGVKVMLASPSERANIKQYSINFVIGAFILIGGVGFLTVIKNFASKIGEGGGGEGG